MLAVQDVVPALLTPVGPLTHRIPDAAETAALALAARAAERLGSLDIGQAVVASPDRVIAVEAVEGTREMLRRVAGLRAAGRLGRTERCVLVKSIKPQQDLRFDLPSIGTATIAEAREAGLTAIGLSAGRSLILGLDDVVAAADAANIALVGLLPEPGPADASPIDAGSP
nr:LpxI family protein [Aurantimonas sp. VKM B-3413]